MSAPEPTATEPDQLLVAAARNNAEWCAAICRSHDITSTFDENAWWSATPAPQFYPDVITLRPDAGTGDVLAHLPSESGCSVKDSFAKLSLHDAGFIELFDARWIYRSATPPTATNLRAEMVGTAADLAQWQSRFSDGDEDADVFRPGLLADPNVRVLTVLDGDRKVGGAVLNRAADLVGVSNVFADDDGIDDVWRAAQAAAAAVFPGIDLVGYESDEDPPPAIAAGFRPIGSLRVWLDAQ